MWLFYFLVILNSLNLTNFFFFFLFCNATYHACLLGMAAIMFITKARWPCSLKPLSAFLYTYSCCLCGPIVAGKVKALNWGVHEVDNWCFSSHFLFPSKDLPMAKELWLTAIFFLAVDPCAERRRMCLRLGEVVREVNPEASKYVGRGVWCG